MNLLETLWAIDGVVAISLEPKLIMVYVRDEDVVVPIEIGGIKVGVALAEFRNDND